MALTNDHATSLRDDQYQRFEDLWRELTAAEAGVWARFNRWWLQAPVPLLVVRYEDLVNHRHRTLKRVAWFLRGERELEGTPWSERVEAASNLDDARASYYVPREPGKLPGASLRHFDDEARQKVAEAAGSLLNDFGYGDRFPDDTTVAPRAVRRPVPPGDARHDVVDGSPRAERGPRGPAHVVEARALHDDLPQGAARARDGGRRDVPEHARGRGGAGAVAAEGPLVIIRPLHVHIARRNVARERGRGAGCAGRSGTAVPILAPIWSIAVH